MPQAVTRLLRLEGLAFLLASVALFAVLDGSWLLFAVLLLAPDLAMLGYLRGPRVGAVLYNAAHTYPVPVVVGLFGLWGGSSLALHLALIWTAHIGMDRALGYGLKLPEGFQHTHLGRIGKEPPRP
jgi:hypothetical protein